MNDYKKLINRLAERACVYHNEPHQDDCYDCRKKKSILIGDVLSKMTNKQISMEGHKVMWLWQPCGFTKSLQEILEDNTINTIWVKSPVMVGMKMEAVSDSKEQLTKEATELFEFILKLNLK